MQLQQCLVLQQAVELPEQRDVAVQLQQARVREHVELVPQPVHGPALDGAVPARRLDRAQVFRVQR